MTFSFSILIVTRKAATARVTRTAEKQQGDTKTAETERGRKQGKKKNELQKETPLLGVVWATRCDERRAAKPFAALKSAPRRAALQRLAPARVQGAARLRNLWDGKRSNPRHLWQQRRRGSEDAT